MTPRSTLLALLAALLTACAIDKPYSPPLSEAARLATVRLDSIGAAIDDYRFPAALDSARTLRPWAEARADSLPDTLRARMYQYLSELHSKRWMWFDSITYYTQKAEALVDEEDPLALRVRQLYVKALGRSQYDRTWVDIMMTADLGLQLLEEAGDTVGYLYPKLLVVRANGGKKYADIEAPKAEQEFIWHQSEAIMQRAAELFTQKHTARWTQYVQTQLAILLTRFEDRDDEIFKTISMVGKLDCMEVSVDSLRLLGYFHNARNRSTKAVAAYQKLLRFSPFFEYRYDSEGYFFLGRQALELKDFGVANDATEASMLVFGCCASDGLQSCKEQSICGFYRVEQARVLLHQFQHEADTSALAYAHRLGMHALSSFEQSLVNNQEESVLNIIDVIGRRMLDVCLTTSYETANLNPDIKNIENLFYLFEKRKSILLKQYLFDNVQRVAGSISGDQLNQMRSLNANLIEYKKRYMVTLNMPSDDLRNYQQVMREYNTLRQTTMTSNWQSIQYPGSVSGGRHSLSIVRRQLRDKSAYMTFADTDTHVYGFYIDMDTILISRVPRIDVIPVVQSLKSELSKSALTPEHNLMEEPARKLYQYLVKPIEFALINKDHILVSPSISLQELPFSAFLSPKGRYLVEDVSVRYVDSWNVEMYQKDRRHNMNVNPYRPGTIAYWASPDVSSYFVNLERFLASTRDMTKITVNKQGFGNINAEYIQIAAHAMSDEDRIHNTYITLPLGNNLSDTDIATSELQTKLVVLAACSTAKGVAKLGEGNFTLRRSFYLAGAPDVISSIYNVPATATTYILRDLYQNIFNGYSPEVALAMAQRAMLSGKHGSRYRAPVYWAGMIVG